MGVSGIAVRAHLLMQNGKLSYFTFSFVIPAKARIQLPKCKYKRQELGPRLRGGDEKREGDETGLSAHSLHYGESPIWNDLHWRNIKPDAARAPTPRRKF